MTTKISIKNLKSHINGLQKDINATVSTIEAKQKTIDSHISNLHAPISAIKSNIEGTIDAVSLTREATAMLLGQVSLDKQLLEQLQSHHDAEVKSLSELEGNIIAVSENTTALHTLSNNDINDDSTVDAPQLTNGNMDAPIPYIPGVSDAPKLEAILERVFGYWAFPTKAPYISGVSEAPTLEGRLKTVFGYSAPTPDPVCTPQLKDTNTSPMLTDPTNALNIHTNHSAANATLATIDSIIGEGSKTSNLSEIIANHTAGNSGIVLHVGDERGDFTDTASETTRNPNHSNPWILNAYADYSDYTEDVLAANDTNV